jgi:hypothetical protein
MLSSYAGPDGQAVHLEDRCGLGYAWLRTSPAEVAQPITLDGSVWSVADIRLDDRTGLIVELREHRRSVSDGLSDAELLLHAYAVWEERCLDHLEGDFSFALWDCPRQRLMCARDQLESCRCTTPGRPRVCSSLPLSTCCCSIPPSRTASTRRRWPTFSSWGAIAISALRPSKASDAYYRRMR